MGYLPVTVDSSPLVISWHLNHRHILIVGACEAAAHVSKNILASGGVVTALSCRGRVCEEICARAAMGEIGLIDRDFSGIDLDGKDMCVIVDASQSTALVQECRKRRIPVSVPRNPHLGDFSIEIPFDLLSTSTSERAEIPDANDLPLADQPSSSPPVISLPDLPASPPSSPPAPPRQHGKLFLVGAGPGAADLLTVRALAALKAADLVVSDRLVSPDVIRLIHTEIIFARKVCGRAREAQDEIYTWTLRALREGKTVVRLKGGDPFVFGRGGEEVIYFSRYGYVPTVIPGISSSISAPLSAGIPITHRGVADQVVIATGRREDGSTPEYPHYSPRRTCVFLMAMGTLRSLTAQLTGKHSFPPNCPCAVVEKATFTEQRVLHGTLETIWQQAEALKITSHATLIVGDVVHALDVTPGTIIEDLDLEHAVIPLDDVSSCATMINEQ